jgi:type II secretory pathway component PulC
MMSVRHTKLALKVTCVGLWIAMALVTAWTVLGWETEMAVPDTPAIAAAHGEENSMKPAIPTLQQFATVWHKPLRRPLFDPPPAAAASAAVAVQAPLNIKLLGTAIEAEESLAIFAIPPGTVEVKRVGEAIGEGAARVQVREIQGQRVILERHGRPVTLEMDTKPGN